MTAPAAGRTRADVPELGFAVTGPRPEEFAAVPTLRFDLGVERLGGPALAAASLTVDIRIDVTRRAYPPRTHRALAEIFGLPGQWARSMRPLAWTQITVQVPPVEATARLPLTVGCTTDTELAVTRYLRAVGDEPVPLVFLFTGTLFYRPGTAAGPLLTARVPWTAECDGALPAGLWQDLVRRYYGDAPWLRLTRETYDRLDAHRVRHVLPGPEAAVTDLIDRSGAP
ncbi:DUF6084 family protein [Streptomyces sp. NPDC051018]|uniref:DUF6084 family protein n=1 Tax=Streptomyces sp. NPDC051018 TaxID=3365639 RepID=UPI0037B217BA